MYGSRCLGVIHKEERILGGVQSLCLSVFREKILISSESNTLYYNGFLLSNIHLVSERIIPILVRHLVRRTPKTGIPFRYSLNIWQHQWQGRKPTTCTVFQKIFKRNLVRLVMPSFCRSYGFVLKDQIEQNHQKEDFKLNHPQYQQWKSIISSSVAECASDL